METKTIEDFEAFVRTQDPELKINHFSWEVCAIGAWAKSLRPEITLDRNALSDLASDLSFVIKDGDEDLYEILNNNGFDLDGEVDGVVFPTYGSLVKYFDNE